MAGITEFQRRRLAASDAAGSRKNIRPDQDFLETLYIPEKVKDDSEGIRVGDGVYCWKRKYNGVQANGRVERIFFKDEEVLVEFFTNLSGDMSPGDCELYSFQAFYDGGWEPKPLGQWHLNTHLRGVVDAREKELRERRRAETSSQAVTQASGPSAG